MSIIWITLAIVGAAFLLLVAEALGRAIQRFDRLRDLAQNAPEEE